MASYTGLRELKNHPHRSGFDISQKNVFSAKVGELLPVYWDIAIPGNTYEIKPQYFTRTQPLNTSAFTRIREYFDIYEVPISLLWKSAPSALTQMGNKNPIQATALGDSLKVGLGMPSFPLSDLSEAIFNVNQRVSIPNPTAGDIYNAVEEDSNNAYFVNQFGFSRGSCSYKLLRYLQYGNIVDPAGESSTINWATNIQPGDAGYNPNRDNQQFRQNAFVNALPLLAYNKIYQDFFRWSQWEEPDPSSYNCDYYDGTENRAFYGELPASDSDYWKSPTMFDLRYANFKKDLFMGVLPETQFGDVSQVLSTSAGNLSEQATINIPANSVLSQVLVQYRTNSNLKLGDTVDGDGNYYVYSDNSNAEAGDNIVASNMQSSVTTLIPSSVLNGIRSQFSILSLRRAEAVQRWKEITQSGDFDYRTQIEKHFGVKLPQFLSNMAIWHGGISRNLDISEVVNTNLESDTSSAYIHGKGTGSGDGYFKFKADDYAVIMVIYHAEPVLDYVLSGPTGQLWATSATDMPIPEFDNIGMESVHLEQFFNTKQLEALITDEDTAPLYMGYQPRYYPWKTKLDIINGAFTSTLESWVAAYDYTALMRALMYRSYGKQPEEPGINARAWSELFNYNVFRVNPHMLDSIFAEVATSTWDSDQLLINSYFDVKLVENLSRDGLPY